jgi:hypothetical protein
VAFIEFKFVGAVLLAENLPLPVTALFLTYKSKTALALVMVRGLRRWKNGGWSFINGAMPIVARISIWGF